MGLFGRGRRNDDALGNDASTEAAPGDAHAPAEDGGPEEMVVDTSVASRVFGPWDESDDYPEELRVDLGALLIPQRPDVRIQVQADPSSGAVSQLSLVSGQSAVQVQPYAAPRSGGMWEDIRGQIKSSINKSGGLVEEADGPFGTELRAQVKGQDGAVQPARFCGVDGPRWFVRLVFLGQSARDQQSFDHLGEVIRSMVVVRGNDAMPMGNALALRVPQETVPTDGGESIVPSTSESSSSDSSSGARPRISLPVRGPEITETR